MAECTLDSLNNGKHKEWVYSLFYPICTRHHFSCSCAEAGAVRRKIAWVTRRGKVCTSDRSYTETVTLLARMARFIIADQTMLSSLPQELQAIVPHVQVPVQPLLVLGHEPWAMFIDFSAQHLVHQYSSRMSCSPPSNRR